MITIVRHQYSDTETIGVLFVAGRFFSYTLEDRVRLVRSADGPVLGRKVPGRTAIPAGKYNVRATYSPRFKRVLVEVLEVPQFTYIRIHGGNTAEDTEGCPLVAENAGPSSIGGRAVALSKELAAIVESAESGGVPATLEVIDNPAAHSDIMAAIA